MKVKAKEIKFNVSKISWKVKLSNDKLLLKDLGLVFQRYDEVTGVLVLHSVFPESSDGGHM